MTIVIHSSDIPVTLIIHSGDIWKLSEVTFRIHSSDIQVPFMIHSKAEIIVVR